MYKSIYKVVDVQGSNLTAVSHDDDTEICHNHPPSQGQMDAEKKA